MSKNPSSLKNEQTTPDHKKRIHRESAQQIVHCHDVFESVTFRRNWRFCRLPKSDEIRIKNHRDP